MIINVVDASNLERNLYLTTELIDMDRSMVIALNMADELERSGRKLDFKTLGEMIGVPIVPTSARNGSGINELFDTVISVFEGTDPAVRHIHVNLGNDIEQALSELKDTLKENPHIGRHFSPRYLAIKLLESDSEVEDMVRSLPDGKEILGLRDKKLQKLSEIQKDADVNMSIANAKYGFIAGALAETLESSKKKRSIRHT